MEQYNISFKAARFFVYSFIGLDINNEYNEEQVINACIERAFRDMSRTMNYTYSISALNDKSKDFKLKYEGMKANYKLEVKNLIKGFVQKKPVNQDKFDEWHNELCKSIIELSEKYEKDNERLLSNDNGDCFSYGQAQKWVNMALKYMWIMGVPDCVSCKSFLHVPIDRYILKQLGCGESYNGKAWSQINYDEYKRIRKKVEDKRKEKCPIEWEFDAWIEQAKNENANK